MNFLKISTAFLLLSTSILAMALDIKPYTQREFDSLAQAGKSVVVHVSAPWCPTCKAQKPTLDSLAKKQAYKDVTILSVDFDSEKNLLKQYKVNTQSTLIGFKAGKETSRSVGDTSEIGIESIFQKAMN